MSKRNPSCSHTRQRPPGVARVSSTRTEYPALARWHAALKPENPHPITTTFFILVKLEAVMGCVRDQKFTELAFGDKNAGFDRADGNTQGFRYLMVLKPFQVHGEGLLYIHGQSFN